MIIFKNLSKIKGFEHGITEIGDPLPESMIQGEQVHKTACAWVDDEAPKVPQLVPGVDVLATRTPGVTISARVADCVPIILTHPQKRIVAVVHAGWRGTALSVTRKAIEWLRETERVNPAQLVVGVGPAIGPDDFIVDEDVARQFSHSVVTTFEPNDAVSDASKNSAQKFKVDLWQANVDQLIEAGVSPKNIEVIRRSTYSDDKLYSARRGNREERNIAWVQISS